MLRTAKLTVADEIENALSYYRATFLRADPAPLPRARGGAARPRRSRRFFRMGNWIGGDRDGNPFVDADTLRTALARQSETALRHYLTAGARARRRAVDLGDAGAGDAPRCRRSPTRSADAQRAPRGRAVPPRADRHLCAARRDAARAHRHRGAAPRGRAAATPYAGADEFLADLRTIEASLRRAPRRRRWSRRAWRR